MHCPEECVSQFSQERGAFLLVRKLCMQKIAVAGALEIGLLW